MVQKRIVIIGAGGRLGAALQREYRGKFDVFGLDRTQLDVADGKRIADLIGPLQFDVLINAAALTNVDYCETNRDEAFRINAEAPRLLAEICRDKGAKLIHISTDYVFDGDKREPYTEEDEARPISVYGESKRAGEENVLAVQDRHLVVRVSWVFGPDRPSFIDAVIKRARRRSMSMLSPTNSPRPLTRSISPKCFRAFFRGIGFQPMFRRSSARCRCHAFCISPTPANAAGRNTPNGRSIVAARPVCRSRRATLRRSSCAT